MVKTQEFEYFSPRIIVNKQRVPSSVPPPPNIILSVTELMSTETLALLYSL